MKIILLLLLTVLLSMTYSYSQKVSLEEQNESLVTVFSKIEKQTGYSLAYTKTQQNKAHPVSIHVVNAPVEEVIKLCFSNQPFTYIIVGKTVVVKPAGDEKTKTPVLSLQTVRGTVYDEHGNPLESVSVKNVRTGFGSSTNNQGAFTISARPGDLLEITMVGYKTASIKIENDTTVIIKMELNIVSQSEVVVVGYGTQKKIDVTGAISGVNKKDIAGKPVANAMQALGGRIPGVNITQPSGAPGQAPNILIRGVGTTGNNSPLYVVDGMFLNDINFLNPDDIASMQVLKDASSLAIYGVRGANGVIIITTLSGSTAPPKVQYSGYAGTQYTTRKIPMTNATEFAQLVNESDVNAGRQPRFENPAGFGTGTNWFDQIFRRSAIMNHNLSFTGNTENNTYALSVDYLKQDGIIKTSSYDRLTVHFNEENRFGKIFKIGNNMALLHSTNNIIPDNDVVLQAYWMDPTVPVKFDNGNYGYSNLSTVQNPVATLAYNNNKTIINRLVGSVYGELTFFKDFRLRSNFGVDLQLNDNSNYVPVYFVSGFQQSLQSSLSKSRNESSSWLWENTLSYTKSINQLHNVQALVGYTAQRLKNEILVGKGYNVPSNENLRYISAGDLTGQTVTNNAPDYNAFASTLLRLNYDYNHKYLLTASYRRDGSSKFAPAYRYGNFGALGLGWNISEENFMRAQHVFDNLKLRASWGVLGNDKIVDNTYYELINNNYYAVFGADQTVQQGATVTRVANPFVHWEKVEMKDLGLEFSILKKRLSVVVDYYDRLTKDMQVNVPIPAIVGADAPVINAASVNNKGWEFDIKWSDHAGDFSYSLGGNLSTIQNRVISLGNGGQPLTGGNLPIGGISVTLTGVGQPIGSFYGFKAIGVFQTIEEINAAPKQPDNPKPGDLRFADINGDSVINNKDRTFIGSPIPKIIYGFNASFSYKKWDLAFNLQGVYGNKIYNAKQQFTFGILNYETTELGRWRGPGTSNVIPKVGTDALNNYETSSHFIESGSYLRLNNLQIGYSINAKIFNKHASRLRFYVSGSNLFVITKYSGFTPEIGGGPINTGVDLAPYPVASSIVGGVNIGF